uniref:LRRCT domain-containing protein n=1 Tax=Denticeps clupeoides TaxID=299321 RepID=A0AAY4DF62_9TELE
MATRYLLLLCLWTAAVATVQCCPASCSCMDKYNHQLADCASKDLESVPVDLPANVTTLSLSANNIKVLKSKSFVNVTMITSLWLGHNAIVTVERDTLATLVNLRSLDISHNKIVHFPWEDLANLTALQLLKMNNNEMVHLPKDGTFDIPGLSHLQIYNNPFSCSCNLEWLRDWIAQAKISIPEQENTACDAPAHLQGLSVPNIENTEDWGTEYGALYVIREKLGTKAYKDLETRIWNYDLENHTSNQGIWTIYETGLYFIPMVALSCIKVFCNTPSQPKKSV